MWKTYDDGRQEYVAYEDLADALKLRDRVPITVEDTWDHDVPFTQADLAIGSIALRPCPEKKGLIGTYRLWKDKLPIWLLHRIHAKEELPVSMFSFVQMEGNQQKHILLDNLMILKDAAPRCPIERCGVGVYDATMPEAKPKDPKDPPKDEEQPKTTTAVEKTTPPPKPGADSDALSHAQSQVTTLTAQLAQREAQIAEVRQPLVDFLSQRGYTAHELNPLSITTLQRMAKDATQVLTQALPGQVPAPSPLKEPLTLDEAREKEATRHQTAIAKKQADKWSKW